MNQSERRDAGLLYITDDKVLEEQARARRITQRLNTMDRADFAGLQKVAAELFGKSDGAFVNPPFYCDYGTHIELGKNFYANYNCTILDVGKVTFGDYCKLGPNVAVYSAGHPMHPAARNTAYEYGIDIEVGDNVWIGGNTVICPGVHIGSNSVIGAGSVVTRDIPAWSFAAGNPCRVIRNITEADRTQFFHGIPADPEALSHMRRLWEESGDEKKSPSAPDAET